MCFNVGFILFSPKMIHFLASGSPSYWFLASLLYDINISLSGNTKQSLFDKIYSDGQSGRSSLFLLEIVQRTLFADVFSLFSLQDQNCIVYFHKQYLRVPAFYLQLCQGSVLANFCIFDNDRHFEVLLHLKFLNFSLFYISEVEYLFMFKGIFFPVICSYLQPLLFVWIVGHFLFTSFLLITQQINYKYIAHFIIHIILAYSVFSHA